MARREGWVAQKVQPALIRLVPDAQIWAKKVDDGVLKIIRSKDDGMWHLSISFSPLEEGGEYRYPTWDEITEARYAFLPDQTHVAMMLPPKEEYVNLHHTTFHLWELPQ